MSETPERIQPADIPHFVTMPVGVAIRIQAALRLSAAWLQTTDATAAVLAEVEQAAAALTFFITHENPHEEN